MKLMNHADFFNFLLQQVVKNVDVVFEYEKPIGDGETQIVFRKVNIEEVKVVPSTNSVNIFGYDYTRGENRQFRVDRIIEGTLKLSEPGLRK